MADNASIDLDLTRVFDAPRELLYKAFTDADLLARWYGPVSSATSRRSPDGWRPTGHGSGKRPQA